MVSRPCHGVLNSGLGPDFLSFIGCYPYHWFHPGYEILSWQRHEFETIPFLATFFELLHKTTKSNISLCTVHIWITLNWPHQDRSKLPCTSPLSCSRLGWLWGLFADMRLPFCLKTFGFNVLTFKNAFSQLLTTEVPYFPVSFVVHHQQWKCLKYIYLPKLRRILGSQKFRASPDWLGWLQWNIFTKLQWNIFAKLQKIRTSGKFRASPDWLGWWQQYEEVCSLRCFASLTPFASAVLLLLIEMTFGMTGALKI